MSPVAARREGRSHGYYQLCLAWCDVEAAIKTGDLTVEDGHRQLHRLTRAMRIETEGWRSHDRRR
jgi:hypothetical protein